MAEHPLLDSLLEKLLASDDPTERAAIVAESAFDQLPATMALVARRCVVLRWFDATIIAALVDMLPPAERQAVAQATVATLTTLPFVEQLAWGLAYHDQTRAGLLARIQPVLLQQAAALAIPAYRAHTNRTLAEVEALYCVVASGQSSMATQILEDLLEKAARRVDLQTILTLFQTLDQASALSFAAPMPHKAMHYSLRGLARSRLGDFAEAIADFDQAIALKPDNADAYRRRGVARSRLGDFAEAIADFDQAVALEPDDAMSYVGRGAVRSVRGDWAGAIADFDQAIALKPDNAEAYRRRAMARNAQGDRAGAIADYDQAIALKPDYAYAYYNRGVARSDQGDRAGAIADFDQAIALKPDDDVSYVGRGVVRSRLGHFAEAIADFDQAIALKPDDAEAYRRRAMARNAQGDRAGAIADWEHSVILTSHR